MAIHIRVYALPGTPESYSNPAGEIAFGLAEAACRARQPILYRRLTHIDPKFTAPLLLATTIAGNLVPPHHEACTLYVKVSQDGRPDGDSRMCFAYVPPSTGSFEKATDVRGR